MAPPALAHHSSHSSTHTVHAPAFKKRVQHTSAVEKWDVVMWNDEVHSSQHPAGKDGYHHSLSLPSSSTESTSRSFAPGGSGNSSLTGPSLLSPTRLLDNSPSFAATASAFGFGCTSVKPRPIPRRTSFHAPTIDSPQIRSDALASLHRSVEEHDMSFLARMRELEERCHLLPDSLSVLCSDNASNATRGRKRDVASWDEDGDVEMSCWNERRRRHPPPRSHSRGSFGSSEALSAGDHEKAFIHPGSDDEYIVPSHEGIDSNSSSEDEDDDLDIVIVQGNSTPSLLNSTSTPPSLCTSLSSLPARSDGRSPNLRNDAPLPPMSNTKESVDELAKIMAGGAGSVVNWCPASSTDDSYGISNSTAEAGALWA